MKKIEDYKKRFNVLIESEMGDVKPLVDDSKGPVTVQVYDRKVTYYDDGTISITPKNKKIRLYVVLGDINVAGIRPCNGGYEILGKKSKEWRCIEESKIKLIFQFSDTGKPEKISSGSFMEPDLKLKFV
jgi:hypothetical protein